MKRVILNADIKNEVLIEKTSNEKMYVYITKSKKVRILTSVAATEQDYHFYKYGFIDLNSLSYHPVEADRDFKKCISKAINKGMTVYEFDDKIKMFEFILKTLKNENT